MVREWRILGDKSPCLNCRYISEDSYACCAGTMLGIPWTEPIGFCDEFDTDAPIEYPEYCWVVEELADVVEHLECDLEELIEESGNLSLQRKLRELSQWRNWLEIIKADVEGQQ